MATMLIVADDRRTALALRRRLTRLGHTVLRPVTSAVVALAMVRVFQPEAVFLGLDLGGDLDGPMVIDLIEAKKVDEAYKMLASEMAEEEKKRKSGEDD